MHRHRHGIISYRMLALVLASILLASCTGASSDSTTEDPTGTSASGSTTPSDDPVSTTGAPVSSGGILRVLDNAEPRSLNPILENVKPSQRIMWAIMEPLIENDLNFQPSAGLIESWERTSPTTWEFNLADGVTFHNGEPFNADAAAFSILTARDEGVGVSGYFSVIEDASGIDELTLEVTTSIPTGAVPAYLTQAWALPPEYYAEVGGEEFGRSPVGTGAFTFTEWIPGDHVGVSRNEDYWQGPVSLDGIEFRWAPEGSNRVAGIQTGAADLATEIPPQEAEIVEADDSVELHRAETVRINAMTFNIFDPPFDDQRVREAVAHAIDRQAIVDAIFVADSARVWENIYTPQFTATGGHDGQYFDYDPQRSCELLEEVGDIGTVELHTPNGRWPNDARVAEAVAGMLEQACFDVDLNVMEVAAYFEYIFTQEASDMALGGTGALFNHPDFFFATYFRPDAVIQYCNRPDVTEASYEALSVEDPVEQDEVYNDLEAVLMFDLICWVPMYQLVQFTAVADGVGGFTPRADEYIDWRPLSLAP